MKRLGIALFSLILFLAHGTVLANESAPAPDSGTPQGGSGSGQPAGGGEEPDC